LRGSAERQAINTPIQGSAAEMIKIAMINICRELKDKRYKTKLVLQIHDELVFDVPKEEVERVKEMIKEKMINALKLQVPIEVSIGEGKNWLEAH